ncbi:MAG TPA: hypothetical protein VKU77_08235 [Streptosporangiaceae bacterium]|nr:hypothetical protein [Streptosporangiaceae bacterium]
MNTLEIEDRIRTATRAAADTVTPDSLPQLRLPSERPFRSPFRSWFRPSSGPRHPRAVAVVWAQRLAPIAAAVAVIAVAVAMVTVSRNVDHSATSTGSASSSVSSGPGPVKAGPPLSSYVAAGKVPRYYVSVESHGNPNFNPSYAVVRATATGAVRGMMTPAAGHTVLAVTAAADDKTFILDTAPWASSSSNANQSFEPRSFIKLTLSSAGYVQSLKGLSVSVPAGQLMTGFALSPDGSKLALAIQPDNNKHEPDLTEVKVVTLATGAVLTWTANGTIGFGPDDARSLSWPENERTLAFDWEGNGPGIHTGIWLLSLDSGGGSLLAHSREAVTLLNQASPGVTPVPTSSGTAAGLRPASSPSAQPATTPTCQEDSIIDLDGSVIVCGAIAALNETVKPNGSGLQRGAETEYFEYSVGSGKVTRVLGHWTFGSVGALSVEVLWSNASGSVLIGVIPDSGGGRVGVISGNEFTPLHSAAASQPDLTGAW